MALEQRLEFVVLDMIESASRQFKAQPLNLGGLSGALGGVGSPPGGFIGQLVQTKVAYDETEIGTLFTPVSGMSLLDNLNHIRYRLDVVESGGALSVQDYDGNPFVHPVDTITFSGAIVSDLGGGNVLVQVSGGGGSALTVAEYDGSPTVNNVDKITFSGASVTDLGFGDVLVTISGGGGAGNPGGSNRQLQFNDNGVFGGSKILYTSVGGAEILKPNDTGNAGLDFYLQAEDSVGGTADAGDVSINGGNSPGSGIGGSIGIQGGISVSGWGGFILIGGGLAQGTGHGGIIELVPGNSALGGDSMQGYVSINDPLSDKQHRFRTGNSTDHHDYYFPDDDGTLVLDTPIDGITYARRDRQWVTFSGGGSALTVKDADNTPTVTDVDTIIFSGFLVEDLGGGDVRITQSGLIIQDDDGSPFIAPVDKIIFEGGVVTDLGSGDVKISVYGDGPEAFGYNYKIDASSASTTATIAVKTLAGNNASSSDPIIFRIGNTRKEITAALGFTFSSGTNWFNAGGSELASKDVDYFVYIIEETGGSAGVKLGMARIPNARTMGDFVNTSTDEKYILGSWTNFNSDDVVENIGRVTGNIGVSSGYLLGFNGPTEISRPIFHTDWLSFSPVLTGFSGTPTVTIARYQLTNATMRIRLIISGTSNSANFHATLPFLSKNLTGYYQYHATGYYQDNGIANAPGVSEIGPNDRLLRFYRNGYLSFTASGTKLMYSSADIEI